MTFGKCKCSKNVSFKSKYKKGKRILKNNFITPNFTIHEKLKLIDK